MIEDDVEPDTSRPISSSNFSRIGGKRSREQIGRVIISISLIALGITMLGGAIFADSGSLLVARSGSSSSGSGPNPSPPVKIFSRTMPRFDAVYNAPEAMINGSGSYTGRIVALNGDLLLVQLAYSQGSGGNLPDIQIVRDSLSSIYKRVASAFPGNGSNFWEQVWTGRAMSTVSSLNLTVVPDWNACSAPCVSSIIITMTIAQYGGVDSIGTTAAVASIVSSVSQGASVPISQSESLIVELLSHGAYNSCQTDVAQPGSGQISRNCFTGTTERTELFDHSILSSQTCNESFFWTQLEVQRGVYIELKGTPVV